MSTTMRVSPHLSHDNHPAIIFLRLGAMILSIVAFVIFTVGMNTHEQAYIDGAGRFLTFLLLIFVRLFLNYDDLIELLSKTDCIWHLVVLRYLSRPVYIQPRHYPPGNLHDI